MISLTPGRIVWYHPTEHDGIGRLKGEPLAAIVAGVHHDRLVNLAVFDAYGNAQQRSHVQLVQPGDAVPDHAHATWMPYQIGQAAKTEQAEQQLASATDSVNDQITDAVTQSITTDDASPSSSEPAGQ